MKIAVVGLGLIGGSLAKAITKYTEHTVIGIDNNPQILESALAAGAVHLAGNADSLPQADITILAIYPKQTIAYISEHAALFKKGSIVTDTCGIKSDICQALVPVAEKNGFYFIGGHPMAGKETFGFSSAEAELFKNASCILTPCGVPQEQIDILSSFIRELAFSRIVITTPQEHDRMIAFTSQIPHALACAYVLIPECRNQKGFSAGSFRDVSRVAKINENLWTDLFLGNRELLCDELGMLIENLEKIKQAVASGNAPEIRQILKEGRLVKEALDE